MRGRHHGLRAATTEVTYRSGVGGDRLRYPAGVLAVAMSTVLLVAGCGGDDRPSLDGWVAEWEAVTAEAPQTDGTADLDRAACDRLLVAARDAEPDLLPTPDAALDGPVQGWLDLAETIGFECPPGPEAGELLSELEVFEAEAEAGITELEAG